ncbi:hypothetical protein FSARC_14277 [Fusarium sarcochroum]|uniref:Uncharacterized protein n=1 Tax=Fusarium sarcochroum TaxID=1208366 RepID=A0A8H4WQ81_9HYPO|nr:hypothetical protein FSARC_14277 [Fusarium sarcochroum]
MFDTFWDWALRHAKIDRDYYEEADLEWVTGVLPLIAFRETALPGTVLSGLPPGSSAYQDASNHDAIFRMSYLIDYLHTHDPFGESRAHKALNDVDPGFKKLRAFSQIYKPSIAKDRGIHPLDEWKDPTYFWRWVEVNALPRLERVPDLIAEEAADTMKNTHYLWYYMMFFNENKSLGHIRAQRLRIEEPDCWFQSPFFFKFH